MKKRKSFKSVDKMVKKLSSPDFYNYYKNYPRDKFELWLNIHNHKLEAIRTLAGIMAVGLNVIVLLKVFGAI